MQKLLIRFGGIVLVSVAIISFANVAHAATCRNIYTGDVVVPSGFGAAYNLFSLGHEITIRAECTNTTPTLKVGSGLATQYIYKFGYAYKAGAWQQINLQGSGALISSNWYAESATGSLPFTVSDLANPSYIAAFICTWNSGAWQCGCADTTCVSPVWQLQAVQTAVGATHAIAFVRRSADGHNHLYTMNPDGSSVTELVDCLLTECYPSWSPDGTKITVQRAQDGSAIYVVNADGSNLLRLSPVAARDVRPSWSPDGSKIVFTHVVTMPTSGSIPDTEIDVMNADGTNIKTILPSNGTFNVEPRWSPDGSKIVLMRGTNGVSQQIYTMNPDGNQLAQITNQGANGDPFWSPDGSRISFGSNREGAGKLNIFTMKADGSDVQQVTHFVPPYESGDTSWSPDGKKIVFEWDIDGKGQSDPNVHAEVWTVHTDGSGAISTGQVCSAVGCSPRWQP